MWAELCQKGRSRGDVLGSYHCMGNGAEGVLHTVCFGNKD